MYTVKPYVLLVLAAGCSEVASVSEVEQQAGCSDIWCGMNSSKLGAIYTHEFRLDGGFNNEGFAITKVVVGAEVYELTVAGGEIILRGHQNTLTGEAVEGALIILQHEGGDEFAIQIGDSELTQYWADTDARIRTYRLAWSAVNGGVIVNEWTNVCTNPPDKLEARAMDSYSAVVFEGDRVDGASKTVAGPDPSYFNIGCAGHALAKMHLTGHSYPSGKLADLATTVEQRQTFLKMITADYCGDGTSFTVPGTKLDWTADQKWLPYSYSQTTLEGRWSASGVACIDRLRLEAASDPTAGGQFPDGVRDAVKAHCGLPPECTDTDLDNFDGHYLISAIPY